MISDGWTRTTCGLCTVGCGLLVHVKEGKPVDLKGDPDNPKTHGMTCIKGLASLEYLNHPDRLKYPSKRVGKRGQGEWERITWEEALNTIAEALIMAKDEHGIESVVFVQGSNKGLQEKYFNRLANAFGTPNAVSPASVCFVPVALGSNVTYGFSPIPDYEYPPACAVIWGSNACETNIHAYDRIVRALDKGTRLIVVDPVEIEIAGKADLWLQPRPGSDLALALGMINTIVEEELYDKRFVQDWTVGFDKLKTHIQDYAPEKVEKITWVDAEKIKTAARFYATNNPACIQLGNGIEQNVNSFQTARAISILRAITGNLGVPGGEVEWTSLPLLTTNASSDFILRGLEDEADERKESIGENNDILPFFFSPPEAFIRAINEEDPYPIHMAYFQGANPLLCYANAQDTYDALNKLDFIVVSDLFMTPTAALADIVLPAASYLEFDSIAVPSNFPMAQVQQKVAELGECWSDIKIVSQLANKLGLDQYFWDDEESGLDAILKPAGLTFDEFRKVGDISGARKYRSYLENGFRTPSGKVELHASQLDQMGFDPLPVYYELPETPYSDPELAKEYPLILVNLKLIISKHSSGRQISSLRSAHPEPIVGIHPETAARLGISEGDWVHIETKRGRIKQKADITTTIDPRVVLADFAWWFPEKGPTDLYGWAESNFNILTENKPPYSREMGSSNLRGIVCKVYKA